jgi:hypothetical protein
MMERVPAEIRLDNTKTSFEIKIWLMMDNLVDQDIGTDLGKQGNEVSWK